MKLLGMTKSPWQLNPTFKHRELVVISVTKHALKLMFVVPSAALATLLIFALMVGLVAFSDKTIDENERIRLPDIRMPKIDTGLVKTIEKPSKPKIDDSLPPQVPKQDFEPIDGNAAIGNALMVNVSPSLDLNIGDGFIGGDGEYLPIIKAAPQYPRRALSRGIEGYVILEYTVTKQGTVQDPVVVEAQPGRIFNQAAIRSALRYRYKPRVVDGQAIAVSGVRTKITFKLEK